MRKLILLRREAMRPLLWAALLPAIVLTTSIFSSDLSLAIAALFPLQFARIAWRELRKGRSLNDAAVYALACLVGHFAELSGQASYLLRRLKGHSPSLVEYKEAP